MKITITASLILRDGSKTTFAKYYLEQYGKTLDPDQPMLRCGVIHIPPELANWTGLTREQRENYKLMESIAEKTHVEPPERVRALREFAGRLSGNKELAREMADLNVEWARDPLKVKAKLLEAERLEFRKGAIKAFPGGDWDSDLRKGGLYQACKTLNKIYIVVPEGFKKNMEDLWRAMLSVSRRLGVVVIREHRPFF